MGRFREKEETPGPGELRAWGQEDFSHNGCQPDPQLCQPEGFLTDLSSGLGLRLTFLLPEVRAKKIKPMLIFLIF